MHRAAAPIVVGIDGSDSSLRALRWALREGLLRNAPVRVIHCPHRATLASLLFGTIREMRRGSTCMLHNEVAAAAASLPAAPTVEQISRPGRPAAVLLDAAAGARMLVLGARGRSDVDDLTHGHTAQACLRRAPCPVVVIDGQSEDEELLEHPTGLVTTIGATA